MDNVHPFVQFMLSIHLCMKEWCSCVVCLWWWLLIHASIRHLHSYAYWLLHTTIMAGLHLIICNVTECNHGHGAGYAFRAIKPPPYTDPTQPPDDHRCVIALSTSLPTLLSTCLLTLLFFPWHCIVCFDHSSFVTCLFLLPLLIACMFFVFCFICEKK